MMEVFVLFIWTSTPRALFAFNTADECWAEVAQITREGNTAECRTAYFATPVGPPLDARPVVRPAPRPSNLTR
jgi:hypothetical protein